MRKYWIYILAVLFSAICLYAVSGYVSALRSAADLKFEARSLVEQGKGPDAIDTDRLELLLRVQDPAFYNHSGVDVKTAGAGLTTVTQSLAKRLAFKDFKPGIRKIRQTSYAIALERRLTKAEILALFLDSVPMGRGPAGWTDGFFTASEAFYGEHPNALSDTQFIELISVMIAPRRLNYLSRSGAFEQRVNRIHRLRNDACQPRHNKDVWLEGCAQ